ncbi:MAG: hypothetical protein J9259_03070 [Thermoplasmata archaeon YP2-bin.285]|uniref:Endoribonuclease Nob1 n=1 Tax=Candidatus Sysuiplasma superficiale TaxID=2823368 RepID=A0A8J7YNR4_9ARCH|nr:hypothetical protein [Candidatus Sysuiplasma superficiale]
MTEVKGGKVLVLDTSAMYSGTDYPPDAVLYTTPDIVSELRRVYRSSRTEFFVDTRLTVKMPRQSSIEMVREMAKKNGDIARLSPEDIDVLSLAFELKATIVTEDYSIQNTASALGIEYISLYIPAINDYVEWNVICVSCGHVAEDATQKECRICGGRNITKRRKSRSVRDAREPGR